MDRFKDLIDSHSNIVFFGGAGVSTGSGIPDFRSAQGIYSKGPEYLLSLKCLTTEPEVFFEFYTKNLLYPNAKPNATHKFLAKLEQEGKLKAIITQNIDGLHQMAGNKNVIEIHGTTKNNYCYLCGKEYDDNLILSFKGAVPRCPDCGGLVRPDIVLYGEMLPGNAVDAARTALKEADMIIIAGTSLQVEPAASMVTRTIRRHIPIAIFNGTQLDIEWAASFVCRKPMEEFFEDYLKNDWQ